jgi:hypothetical protein
MAVHTEAIEAKPAQLLASTATVKSPSNSNGVSDVYNIMGFASKPVDVKSIQRMEVAPVTTKAIDDSAGASAVEVEDSSDDDEGDEGDEEDDSEEDEGKPGKWQERDTTTREQVKAERKAITKATKVC